MPVQARNSAQKENIVTAAVQLFARQGYHGTSTREIARLADVSENTIFRHFESKEELFWSSLRSTSAGLKLRRYIQEKLEECDSPEVVLPAILDMIADTVTYRPELLRLVAVAFIELHPKVDGFCMEYLSPILSAINFYLEANIKRGKIQNVDPTMLTTSLIMTVLTHQGISSLIDGNRCVFSNSQDAHRAHSRFWLDLIAPRKPAYSWPIAQMPERH